MSQDELTNAVRADIACIEREVSRLIEQAGNGITVIQRHTCEPPPLAAVRGWPQRVRPHTLCQRARVVVAANIQGARLVQRYMHARHATLTESFLHDSSPGTTTGNLRQAAGHAEYQLKQLRDLAVSAPPPAAHGPRHTPAVQPPQQDSSEKCVLSRRCCLQPVVWLAQWLWCQTSCQQHRETQERHYQELRKLNTSLVARERDIQQVCRRQGLPLLAHSPRLLLPGVCGRH